MKLSHQILSYSAFNMANAAVPFLLLPILTAYLLPQEFGMLSLVMMLQALLLPILSMSFQGLVTIEYSKLNVEQFRDFVSSILWLPIFGFLIVTPSLYLFSTQLALLFNIPEFWVVASAIFVLLQALTILMPVLFQARQQLIAYGVYKIGLSLLNVLLSLLFVMSLKYGWTGRLWGILGALVVFNVASLIMLFREGLLRWFIDRTYLRQAIQFGVPLIPHAISGIMLSMSDRIFLVNMASKEVVGIYSVAYQIATAVMIVMSSVNQAWVPHLFAQLNNVPSLRQKRILVKHTYKIMGIMLIGVLIFLAALPVVYHFFISADYANGQPIALIIAIALLFQGFYFMVTNYIFYVKKTHLLSLMTLASASVVMLLNFILVPFYGMFGSAYATLISWILLFFLAWWLAQRVYPMPWLLKNEISND